MVGKDSTTETSDFPSGFQVESLKDFDAAIQRLIKAVGGVDIGNLASFLGISRQAVNKARSANKIPPAWFVQVGTVEKVSIDWLVTGEGPMRRGDSSAPVEAVPALPAEDFKMSDMVTKTIEVLESETIYRTALASNINAFHQAVQGERLMGRMEQRLADLEAKSESMSKEISELRRENRELKQRLEPTGQEKAAG